MCFSAQAQKSSNFQVDAGLNQNHGGFFKLFDGVLEAGAGYNRQIVKGLYGGLAFRVSFLGRQNTPSRTIIYKPRVNLHYSIDITKSMAVIPLISLGYSFVNLSNREFEYRETQSGLNTGGELRVLWKRERKLDYFVFGRFDYIYLDRDESFTVLEQYRKVFMTAFGLGIRIKSGYNDD